MSPVDTAWLRMDSPGNLMMIVGVDILDGPCDEPRLRKVVQEHLLPHFQFRARAVEDPTGVWWEEDEDFDLDRHLVRIALPGKGGRRELQKLLAQLGAQTLDPQRPLWQFHLVEHYDGGHALIVRIHHCVGDGIALMGVVLGMTSTDPARDADAPGPRMRRWRSEASLAGQWLQPLTEMAVKTVDAAGRLAGQFLAASSSVIDDPEAATEVAADAMRVAGSVARDFAALVLMPEDSPTSLKGRPGGSKAVAWNEPPLPLADVKAVGHALGCSVNDILLSCAAGALRGYLADRGDAVDGAELRAMVPVNLRPPGKADSLGNRFGLVPVLLPIGIENPIERVLEVRSRMNALKDSYTALLSLGVLGAAGLGPRALQKQVLDLLASKATIVMTNVPGPQHPLYLAGRRLRQMRFWVPTTGDVGVGLSILSYDGGVQFTVVTDKKLCTDPQSIVDRFAPQFENLLYAALLAPWDEDADPTTAERSLQATESLAQAATHLSGGNGAPAAARGLGEAPAVPPKLPRRRRSAFAAARAAAGQ